MNLSKDTKFTGVQAPLASGGTDLASTYVDMSAFDGVIFCGYLGTAGATDVATLAAWGSTSTGSTGTAISGATVSSSAGEDDKLFLLDISRPRTRYVKTHITRSAAVEYGGTIAQQYGPRYRPTTHTAATLAAAAVLKVPQTT